MESIDVAVLEYVEGGKAIWVHNANGCTVLRIQCTGKVLVHNGCQNVCAHSDINVIGDIVLCVPDVPEEVTEDICGLCGESGADKIPHPIHWPGEKEPETDFVHAECEDQECKRAHSELSDQQRQEFLKGCR